MLLRSCEKKPQWVHAQIPSWWSVQSKIAETPLSGMDFSSPHGVLVPALAAALVLVAHALQQGQTLSVGAKSIFIWVEVIRPEINNDKLVC